MTATNPRQLKFRDFSRENLWQCTDTTSVRFWFTDPSSCCTRNHFIIQLVKFVILITYYSNLIISTDGNVTYVRYRLSLTMEYQKIFRFEPKWVRRITFWHQFDRFIAACRSLTMDGSKVQSSSDVGNASCFVSPKGEDRGELLSATNGVASVSGRAAFSEEGLE